MLLLFRTQEVSGDWGESPSYDGLVRGPVVYTLSKNNRPSLLRRTVQRLYTLEICQEEVDTPHSNTNVTHKQTEDVSRSSVVDLHVRPEPQQERPEIEPSQERSRRVTITNITIVLISI